MAEITKPIALDESFNTTEGSPRNVADVLAQGIGDLVTVVSRISHQTTYDELSDLEDVNISTPTNGDVLTYNGSKWVNGQGGGGASVEQMIAPVETSTTASQAYAIGEQFILNGTLYTATAAITSGGTIVIDGNCTASDSVTEQMDFKYVGMETGNTVIQLPTDWKELNVYVIAKDTAGEIPRRVLTLNTNRHFANTLNQAYYGRSGAYQGTSSYYAIAVEFTTSTVKLNGVTINGADKTSISDIYVYYR